MKSRLLLSAASSCLLAAAPAFARPSGFAQGFERVLRASRASVATTIGGEKVKSTDSHIGAGASGYSYSVPRFGVDYLLKSGLSFGACIGDLLAKSEAPDGSKVSANIFVLEPRVGRYFDLGADHGLWPRFGVTLRWLDGPALPASRHTALTWEVPFLFFKSQYAAATLSPYLDLGLGGGNASFDQTVTEYGVGLGIQLL